MFRNEWRIGWLGSWRSPTGESLTEAVVGALRERLERVTARRGGPSPADELEN